MAGYSQTPLWKKLGYKAGMTVHLHQAPATYREDLGLPDGASVTWLERPTSGVTMIHAFVRSEVELKQLLASYRRLLAPAGAIWISWPKKASKIKTDLTEDKVRAAAFPLGLVDIKVCAVDEVWSGLKLVIRKHLRSGT